VTWKVEAKGRAGDRSQLVGPAEGYKRPSMLCRSIRQALVNSCHGSEVPQSR
jgi:hypothetical protein